MLQNLSNRAGLALIVTMAIAIVTIGPLVREALEGKQDGGTIAVVRYVEARR